MNLTRILIPASPHFWRHAARSLLEHAHRQAAPVDLFSEPVASLDFSFMRVVVSTFEHAQLLTEALAQELKRRDAASAGQHFIPPVIQTMFAWLGMQLPLAQSPSAQSERLMSMYGQLRQHEWLKTLFGAQRNTDLLPLAQTLLNLSDELSQVWLPQVWDKESTLQAQNVAAVWHKALAQLPLPVQKIVSDETQLVWTLWQGQLDQRDPTVQEFEQLMRLAENADTDLFWIAPTEPNVRETAFLQAYAGRKTVRVMSLDWRSESVPALMGAAWPGLFAESNGAAMLSMTAEFDWSKVALCETTSLEDEAEQAAQTIIDWLQAGKQKIAVIAQDRVASRRLRALLERADIHVADETGWKLSTTRAAAALAAWFEVLASRADTLALLDFLKSPFLPGWPECEDKSDAVMEIELALRRFNVAGGWAAVLAALPEASPEYTWLTGIARLAHSYSSSAAAARRSLKEWANLSAQTLEQLGMQASLQSDVAGAQLLQMLQALAADCHALDLHFNFTEWRAFLLLQMENTPFILAHSDKRVMMLPLNGARLRQFDAVYVIGGDARHLPSRPQETLFFSNAVRRECGLVTQEERQGQQLRDFAELLLCNPEIVVSWQSQTNGEFNALCPWLEQVNLMLARQVESSVHLRRHQATLPQRQMQTELITQARPRAAALAPTTLSASGLNSLVACPYQFFAGRMLKLFAMDEFSDRPEKRDYGDWLHAILKTYHDQLLADKISLQADRVGLLMTISEQWFKRILKQSPAALGYSVRWKKVIPAYVEWANQREADGWQFAFGEVWGEHRVRWADGEVLLRGRIDRIDERALDNGATERAVLDYKTRAKSALRTRLKSREDHQLAFYGLLQPKVKMVDEELSLEVADTALYVALELEREKTGDCEAEQFAHWKQELEGVITSSMQAIAHDAELPAQGVEKVCAYCDMRGLCRKGAW